ncbi:MAG: hypothetical protein AAFV45_07000 [Pseudomonadota bacterium]
MINMIGVQLAEAPAKTALSDALNSLLDLKIFQLKLGKSAFKNWNKNIR